MLNALLETVSIFDERKSGSGMIYIGLGANLPGKYGDAEESLRAAMDVIEQRGLKIIDRSSVWETAPVPYNSNQPWYKNAVISISTDKTASKVMALLLAIEKEFGRTRSVKNAPRILDLDLLAYDNLSVKTPYLTVPHPRMHERAFVLNPLKEIAPEWVHPQTGKHINTLLSEVSKDQRVVLPEAASGYKGYQRVASK